MKLDEEIKPRSFCHFVLEPLYKLISKTLSCSTDQNNLLTIMKNEFLVKNLPNKKDLTIDYKPLIRLVISQCFPESVSELVQTMNT